MVRQKLARLERIAQGIEPPRCPKCHGSNGVGGIPLVMFLGKRNDFTTYDEDGRCVLCGAAGQVIKVIVPGLGAASVEKEQG